jgi:phage tail-like protein
MTVGSRSDPLGAYNFLITILDSSTELMNVVKSISRNATSGFSECSGLESTIEVEEYREGGNNGTVLKFPSRATTGAIRLRRGVGLNDDLWRWHNGFVLGRGERKDGLVALQNEDREPVKIWAFHRGLPSRYAGPSLAASDSAVAIEELEIVHEGLALVSASSSLSSFLGAAQAIGDIFR